MNKIEYWLLDHIVLGGDSIGELLADRWNQHSNEPPHDFSPSELKEALDSLFRRGDILAEEYNRTKRRFEDVLFIPSLDQIEDCFTRRSVIYYRLTQQGGRCWEQYSNPDWNKFVTGDFGFPPVNQANIASCDRSLVEAYFACPWFKKSHSVIEGTESWEVVTQWQATYWKTLPIGYRLNFRYTEKESSQEPVLDLENHIAQIKEEYEEFLWLTTNWYRQPTFQNEK
ncbi:MAG: hypothetical protein HY231_10890 [Acidobacteria bacterium]|nr:hypothetical protein [Acidobacteriota bacterium]